MASTAHRRSAAAAASEGDTLAGDTGLPRSQLGTSPQHLLMTLLADYWLDRTEHLPSAALVALLAEFGASEASARAALNRLTKRRLLVASKRGRNTYYGLHSRAHGLSWEAFARIVNFGAHDERAWDGRWTVVAFSVPEAQRQLRHTVRARLRWQGFAALYDGLWCSPWDEQDAALAILTDIGVESATVMRAQIDPRSPAQALSAWDLEALKQEYLEFEEEFSPMLEDARRGAVTASDALIIRTRVMDSWRSFPGVEPDLPVELLPEDWPRSRMRSFFVELYDGLAPLAKARFQQIVAQYSPELAALVNDHTAAGATAGGGKDH